MCWLFCFFFFKQKTAYEMRISDWSSDVCSSDLERLADHVAAHVGEFRELHVLVGVVPLHPLGPALQGGDLVRVRYALVGRVPAALEPTPLVVEIGRASCRERVCQYV